MNKPLVVGLIGLAVTTCLNLTATFVLGKPAAELFADAWWSAWFPSYGVWSVLTITGIGLTVKRGAGGTNRLQRLG